ncbi:MAG: hypothetical protein KAR33_09930 [Candidatus Thorarchaeota archaeon]|nr:hypothetical protein [Candidatus Thorarchaeota archaeon]
MSEEDTYLRAKLTEINGNIERLTDMLNRMIDVIGKITEVQEATSDLSIRVSDNSKKLDTIIARIKSAPVGGAASAPTVTSLEDKGAISSSAAVLENLDDELKEGIIASDLAGKIAESANSLEEKGVGGSVIVKMSRWVRILKTYGRVDTISPTDLTKLRTDIRAWQKELASGR